MVVINKLLAPLILTIGIEVAVALLFGYRTKAFITVVILINVITNLILNSLLWADSLFSWHIFSASVVVLLEVLVIIVEWRLLVFAARQDTRRLFFLSLAMNAASFIAGLFIFY